MAVSLTNTFGMALISFFIDAVLYGIGSLLTFQYFRSAVFPDDRWSVWLTVSTLLYAFIHRVPPDLPTLSVL
ncbi:hypothetical protein JAAARDRAFT_197994 [Jaapia argillacea MUCL 33604]|uniref:Uncharacterized protein n=1 Tax=Jaapia argillacea MUCL 33604 TaxID=933084 RepID=A0A067PCZ0_9AGAM|nr:hypothetical protein JAAARDRAFT_197994 [Jaapia argillacea MUCL 33604]